MARHPYMCEQNGATGRKTYDMEDRGGSCYVYKASGAADRKTMHATGQFVPITGP